MKPDTSGKCARNPNYRSWQAETEAGYGILYRDLCCCPEAAALWTVLAILWALEQDCWLSSHRAPKLESQPGALEAAAQRSGSSIFHYQVIRLLLVFIQFSTLPLPFSPFLTFTSFPSLQDMLPLPRQAFLGKDTNSSSFFHTL